MDKQSGVFQIGCGTMQGQTMVGEKWWFFCGHSQEIHQQENWKSILQWDSAIEEHTVLTLNCVHWCLWLWSKKLNHHNLSIFNFGDGATCKCAFNQLHSPVLICFICIYRKYHMLPPFLATEDLPRRICQTHPDPVPQPRYWWRGCPTGWWWFDGTSCVCSSTMQHLGWSSFVTILEISSRVQIFAYPWRVACCLSGSTGDSTQARTATASKKWGFQCFQPLKGPFFLAGSYKFNTPILKFNGAMVFPYFLCKWTNSLLHFTWFRVVSNGFHMFPWFHR